MKSTRRPLTYLTMALLLAMNFVSVEVVSDPAVEAKPPVLPVPLSTPQDQSSEPPVGAEVAQDDKLAELETIPLAPPASGATLQPGYGRLPMRFEPNQGQSDSTVKFLARGPGYQLFLTPAEAVLVLRQAKSTPTQANLPSREMITDTAAATPTPPAVIRLRLEGMARNPEPILEGGDRLPGYSNYFIGKNPAQWRTQVPHYAKVRYAEVYPGIDLVYYGNPQQLEYDFVVAPGADPGLIQLAFTGVEGLEIDAAGNLILNVAGGRLVQQAPRIWQVINGERHPVEGRYVLRQPDGERLAFQPAGEEPPTRVGFQIAHYLPDLPLVIDPVVLSYSTFVGGSSGEEGYAIAVSKAGQAYVTGITSSLDFPVTEGAAAITIAGHLDVFVAKLNATGTGLEYATYLGGNYYDYGYGIAVDSSGNAYITGYTASEDFPVIGGAAYLSYAGNGDIFVAKLSSTGTDLDYASFLGGNSVDYSHGIAVDSSGNAYITGYTASEDFPVTAGVPYPGKSGGYDAFVAKFNAAGTDLDYASFLGGNAEDFSKGIAVDGMGNAYITGYTSSEDFPVTAGVPYPSKSGGYDAFVAKFNAAGTDLDYASFLGGHYYDNGQGIAVDGAGNAYITGYTDSHNFPITQDAAYPSLVGGSDVFVAKFNSAGTTLDYATYFGGQNEDSGHAITVDARSLVYVTGQTQSGGFPVRYAPYSDQPGPVDAFLAVFTPDGTGLVYGSYLGGSYYDAGYGVAVDSAGNAYVTGSSGSSDFPTTGGAFDTDNYSDAFVAKFTVEGKLLLVNRTGDGSGLISSTQPDGTIDCGSTCSAIHPTNTAVRLLAATQPVSTFAGWGGDCAASGVALTCNLTLATDRTVSASFVPRTDDIGISQVLDLDQALPGIDWYQAGSAPWFAQDRVTHDGVDAAQSGAIGDNQSSELEATVTGPAYLSFWWKVSSEQSWDYLRFYLDELEKGAITGETDWMQVFVYVPTGSHTLTWAYEKDETGRGGQDAGWLDGVVFDNADRTLVIEPPVGGTITGADGGSYPLGTSLNLVAEPATGYYFGGWGGDCQSAGMASDCALVMDVDKQVSAVFIQVLQGGATAVAAGSGHSCAVAGGGVRCWGDNDYGQLGNGLTIDSSIPVHALPPNSGAAGVAAGSSHSCAVVAGGVKCWGNGGNGQLGNGSWNSSATPVQAIPAGSGATDVAAGYDHSCAVVDGGVKCWGVGWSGQLGNGSTNSSSTPVQVIPAGKGATAVAAGGSHTCAVVDGGVKCWGNGGEGQLGNGSWNSSSTPIQAIPVSSEASAIATGGSHTCAVVAGGVLCWGYGGSGQLGNGSGSSSATPVQAILAGSGATDVAAGSSHSCTLIAGGVKCWGAGWNGQLGNGSTNSSSTPVQAIPAANGVTAVAAGGSHTCAVVDGGVKCWGDNGSGQLGDDTQSGTSVPIWTLGLGPRVYVDILNLQVQGAGRVTSTPPGSDCTANCTLRYPAPTTVTLVATAGGLSSFAGWEGDCATATGTTCELTVAGTKTAIARFAPLSDAITRSLDLEGAVWTEGGDAAWFAQERVTHDGIAAAQSGAIGDNQTSQLSTTLTGPGYLSFWWKVSSEAGWDYLRFYLDGVEQGASTGDTDWTQISLYLPAGSHTLTWVYEKDASDAGGEDAGWLDQLVFDNANRTLIIDPPTGGIISGGSAGTYPFGTRLTLTATADSDHYFAGWGGDCAGTGQAESCELTLNSDKRVSASFLPLLKGATTDVAAGYGHSCAVAAGGVRCWGNNYSGQLGNGTTIEGLVPVQAIPAGSGASAVAAGGSHSCAVVEGGVQCWGAGGSGQLGNGSYESSLTPVWAIPAGSGVNTVATGGSHSCAVVGGGVQCWGDGSSGQLGNGSYDSSPTPVWAIPVGKGGATAVAAGYSHSCAVVAGGIKCWGTGPLGNGSYASSPIQTIPAGSGASAIAAAGTNTWYGTVSHSCAVVSGGVQCWGSGDYGQLGNGSYASSPTPVQTIPAGSGATTVTAGASYDRAHSCAVVASGVQCWGSGGDGQLGKGSYESSLTPVHPFPAGSEASTVAAGGSHSCALIAGGVQCWGANWSGRLGDGTQEGSAYPRPVIGLASDLGPGIPVTASAGPGGSISPPWVSVPSGATTTFTVTPDQGYSIASVSGCSGTQVGDSYTTGAITAPCTVSASFSQNSYLITATANPAAGGTVTCAPNSVTHGGTSRCTAEVASGYGFVNWGGDCSGTTPTCTLTNITGPREVTANLIDLSATLSVTQSAPGYQGGGLLRVSVSLNDTSGTSPLSLLWRPHLPAGWTLASVSGEGSPELSQDGSEILFTGNLGAIPLDFSYQVAVPADAQGQQVISATVEYQNGSMTNPVTLMATPNPLILDGILYHSADYRDARWQIDSSEASRVLAYWRAGVYHVEASGEDGYAPGTGGIDRNRHSADYQAPYWWIDGSEANRVLAYWRAAAYHADADGVDGFAPGVKPSGAQAASRMAAAATSSVSAGHSAPEYQAGEILTVTNTLDRPAEGTLLSLLWTPSLPTGWSIRAVSGDGGPELGPDGQSILFTGSLTANPLHFSYQVAVPADANGEHSLSAVVEYQTSGAINAQLGAAQPQPLVVQQRVLDMKTLAVTTNPASTGSGTVTGGGTYPAGTRVTPSAIPDQGSAFAGWEPTSCGAPFALMTDTVCQATFNLTPPPQPVTVFADSFESTSFAGRWTQDSQNDWFVSTQRRTVGSRSAEVDGSASNAQLISVPITTGGASSATITFSWFNETSLDTNEYLAFDVSTDGGTTWTEKARLRANADPENVWRPVQVNLTGLAPTASLRLRFRGTMSDYTEDSNLDNVMVTVNPTPAANQAPSANAGGPYSGYAGRSLVFSATGSSDADGTLVSYVWDFGDGSRGVGATASHTYASTGDYDVTLTVTDNGGATATDVTTATLAVPPPNQPPQADAGGPYTGSTGQALTVSAAGSADPDGSIVRYDWDFGDGTTGTGMTASHTYATAGTYTLTVTVSDDAGDTDVATTTVTVVSAPVTVFADSFESTSFAGRWTQDSQNDWFVSTQRRTVGSRSAEVDGSASNAQLISVPIATGGASSATITFSWFNETSLDTNEYLAFDVSTDGGTTWTEKARLRANADPENVWRPVQVNLTGLAPTASLRLRFRGTMSDYTEDSNLDNVLVTVQ